MPTIKVTAEQLARPMATRNWKSTPAPARRGSPSTSSVRGRRAMPPPSASAECHLRRRSAGASSVGLDCNHPPALRADVRGTTVTLIPHIRYPRRSDIFSRRSQASPGRRNRLTERRRGSIGRRALCLFPSYRPPRLQVSTTNPPRRRWIDRSGPRHVDGYWTGQDDGKGVPAAN